MDDYLKKQSLDKLSRARNILIAVTKDSNLDALAAGLALYLSLKKVGKIASIMAKEPNVGEARQLYAIDKIGSTNDKNDLLITVNNAIKNVDKVTYYLEGDQLKIVVHSLQNTNGISKEDIFLENTATKPDLIFAIGYESANQLKQEITHEQNIDPNRWIISINVGNMTDKFAQVHFNDESSNSLSELTTKLLQELSLPLNEDISFNLYSGVKFATNSFSPQSTNQSALAVAQYLLKFSPNKASLAKDELNDKQPGKISKNSFISQPIWDENRQTPIEKVEFKENLKESWLKPPKIYRGSKSFDRES